jgi:hypothetical protein
MIGNYRFALDYGCVHPGMPLCRKQFRRSRDAPIFPQAMSPLEISESTWAGRLSKNQ